jgi:hypothetical protein
MSRREEWKGALDLEVERWSKKSYEELCSELRDSQDYSIELEGKTFQVEVQLLGPSNEFAQVSIAIDDGSLPASLHPLTHDFIRYKNGRLDV